MSAILYIPVDRELSYRVRWLIKARWITLLLAIVLILVGNRWLRDILPLTALWGTLAAIAVYNFFFWIIASRLVGHAAPYESHLSLMHLQIITDLLALTVLLHFSGGLENPFSPYYLLLVVVGSVLTTKRASYLYATIASVLWVGLLITEAVGILPHHNLAGFRLATRYREPLHIASEAFVLVSANFGVAFLSSSIIERLREGERQLYEANTACELRAAELAELNKRLQEANAACELRAAELAELSMRLQEANASCELRAEELARLNRRLQELDQTRSLFIRLVTHELRAPVAAIQSYLRLILDGYVPQERLQEIIAKAEQRARDQLELIGDLLELARVQEPKDKMPPEPVDIAAILRDVLDLMQVRAQDKSITLSTDVPADLPKVMATKEHVRQIWINLISNAIKYTPDGGKVHISLREEGDMVRGAVQDTGIGIAPEEQERIFEDFYRTEAAKAMAHHGTGLGLSIVKGIMERYGGRIWLTSKVGEGSTFFFELPKAA